MSSTEGFSYVPAALLGWIHQLSDEHQGYVVLGLGASKKQVDTVENGPPYLWLQHTGVCHR